MDFAFFACKNWASHLWMRATCLQKPARMEYHVLKVSLDVFFGTFIHFSEILNFDFPIGGKKFLSWIFIFSSWRIFAKSLQKSRQRLLQRRNMAYPRYGFPYFSGTCLLPRQGIRVHEERCRTARNSPEHHIKHKNNGEGLCLFILIPHHTKRSPLAITVQYPPEGTSLQSTSLEPIHHAIPRPQSTGQYNAGKT